MWEHSYRGTLMWCGTLIREHSHEEALSLRSMYVEVFSCGGIDVRTLTVHI